MKHHDIPPSPFGAGTTYSGHEKRIVPPRPTQSPPRIARSVGAVGLEHTHSSSRIESERSEEEEHLRRLFAFPDASDDRMHMRTSVTDESLKDAENAYLATNSDIKNVIHEFVAKKFRIESEVAESIRNDDGLRLALGKHLLDKLNRMHYLPSRLTNDQDIKRPNVQGYDESMTSKEYATLLAISMLDGTYKDSPGDKIYINRYGEVKNGQHRYAAQEALGIGRIAKNREHQ